MITPVLQTIELLTAEAMGHTGVASLLQCGMSSSKSISTCALEHSALSGSLLLCIAIIVYSFVWSVLGNNCSKVDQIWSITPFLFGWYWYVHDLNTQAPTQGPHERLLLVCVCMTAWGVRLTYNFWRRGGYGNLIHHEEDYRWPILREMIGRWGGWPLFLLFNITFISAYQNLLLWLIAAPAHAVMVSRDRSLNTADCLAAAVFAILLALETLADQQHWNYHQLKKYAPGMTPALRKRHPDPDVVDGFFQSGLWRYSRHPNYFFEQSIWFCVYGFTLTHGGPLINAYLLGPVLLVLLFQGSISFGESITLSKYPKYVDYCRRTSQCIPFFPLAKVDKAE